MAYDAEVSSDAEMLNQDGCHVGLCFEELSELVEPEELEIAGEAEEDADEEAD